MRLLVAALLALIWTGGLAQETFVIQNGTVIDGTGAPPIPNGVVIIKGERILDVGPASEVEVPKNATVVDAAGGTIMPGIVNAHIHFGAVLINRYNFLKAGVTSVCDLGSSLPSMEKFAGDEDTPQARGFKAGPIVTAPGGYPGPVHGFALNYEISGPEEAEAAVANLYARGADYVKLALEPGFGETPYPVLSAAELRATVTAAHERGLLARVHVQNPALLSVALDADADVIEHLPVFSRYTEEEWDALLENPADPPLPEDLEAQFARMAAEGVVLVPTLGVLVGELFDKPQREPWEEVYLNLALKAVRLFHDLGGTVALGNDYGNPGVELGMPLREMRLFLAAGLSPFEVLSAATAHAADACGQGETLGTLTPDKLADVIVVAGDSLEDITVMDQVRTVIKGGHVVYGGSPAN